MSDIIKASGIKLFGSLKYPEITLSDEKTTFITGESGCGKSSLLKVFNATLIPDEGTVFYNNRDISGFDKIDYRRRVVLVPQEVFLTDGTIKENFEFYYRARGESVPDDDKINSVLKLCCLEYIPDMPCGLLSGGERQRVFLAIFVSFDFEVLLLDEPTAALDEITARILLTNLKCYCRENRKTLAAVCHNSELVKAVADEIITVRREREDERDS